MSASPPRLPSFGPLAGIDYGARRIGVAICDPGRKFCFPHVVFASTSEGANREFFTQLVRKEGLVGFVVGLPLHTDGAESATSREAREFAGWLAETTSLPVDFHDERYTSHAAEQLLAGTELTKKRRRARLDALAAQLILESYLERPASE